MPKCPDPGRDKAKKRSAEKKKILGYGFFLMLLVMLLISLAINTHKTKDYVIVVDAGSSGTRLYIYGWKKNKAGEFKIAPAFEEWKITPGVSEYSLKVDEIFKYLTPLKDYSADKLGETYRHVPVYFMATGGVRLLPEKRQRQIMEKVREALNDHDFKVEKVQVISGEMEGVYAWVSANLLLGTLNSRNGPHQTFGVLEMGGASTQIAFVPLTPPKEHFYKISLEGMDYSLYTFSYNGLGLNSARKSFLDPKTCGTEIQPDRPARKTPGNFERCKEFLEAFLASESGCTDCALLNIYQPDPFGSFITISSPVYMKENFRIRSLSSTTLDAIGRKYCPMTESEAEKMFSSDVRKDSIHYGCFDLAYMSTLLSGKGEGTGFQGMGFSPATERIIPSHRINNDEITWTLGAAILEVSGGKVTKVR